MKTILITTIGALLLTAGGVTGIHADRAEAANQNVAVSNYSQQGDRYNNNVSTEDLTSLPEYKTLAAKVDVSKYSAQIVVDNLQKRVIVLKDMNGRERYKTVFVKTQNRLKIVDYKGGMIFNKVISGVTDNETQPASGISDEVAESVEYKKLSATTDLSDYSAQVVEDNLYKRIILFKDANGHVKFKTIYVKKTGFVKIINV
ncbi:hypothetical protein FQ087_09030 [Sporosarcina sp. ANT_H38]|uniref:hypothetical protein n=1 Tax=Sporosarcina sp. ANT_H38 TaxID=2597358 RepID=UPI0011F3AFD3|nr:hypothetical protein [Sporosarcina sp. ANT_H38]KAA0966359.1 hypothetical protein FQ087_09030 [Sporosarcina sp. ANT_H38]